MTVGAGLSAPLALASASPRRREILERLGVPFEVVPADVDESMRDDEAATSYVFRVAADKANAVAATLAEADPPPFVLGADTVVVVDGAVLGKPRDDEDALSMLTRLAGRMHEVTTAVALARAGEGVVDVETVTTRVWFRELSDAELRGYVASGEGVDKAGAYAIQGLGSGLVSGIRGSYDNVVGLPGAATLDLLRRAGVLRSWP